jgi:putative peptide zinc metalloprotease protein
VGQYTEDSRVEIYPFVRQVEEEDVVIGNRETQVFLVLPADAVALLDDLASGKTVGEAQSGYFDKYGEIPDMEFLEILEAKGFLRPLGQGPKTQNVGVEIFPIPVHPPVRFHFAHFPQSLARRLFSRPVLIGCGVLITMALVAIALDASILPTWNDYYFQTDITLTVLTLMILDCGALCLHEMAHLIAAKALGVSCRMGISNRLWMLVAETDMTGIWGVPKHKRYFPFLAGPLVDSVSAAMLLLLVFSQNRGWVELSPKVLQLSRAMALTYLLNLLWQCYLFVRTDFYYIIANAYGCKNLLQDTEVFLRNQLSRVIRSIHYVDQSHISVRERRVIRRYAVLWLVGRLFAFSSLSLISIPLLWHYLLSLRTTLGAGYQTHPAQFVDALLLLVLVLAPQVAGLFLWMRSFRRGKPLPAA